VKNAPQSSSESQQIWAVDGFYPLMAPYCLASGTWLRHPL